MNRLVNNQLASLKMTKFVNDANLNSVFYKGDNKRDFIQNFTHTGSYTQINGSLEGIANFGEQRQKPSEAQKSRMYFRSKTSNLDQLGTNNNSIVVYSGFDLDEDKVPEILPNLAHPSRKSLEMQPR